MKEKSPHTQKKISLHFIVTFLSKPTYKFQSILPKVQPLRYYEYVTKKHIYKPVFFEIHDEMLTEIKFHK